MIKKRFCFVLFKSKVDLEKATIDGLSHTIKGFLIECRQSKLKVELKIELDEKLTVQKNNQYSNIDNE